MRIKVVIILKVKYTNFQSKEVQTEGEKNTNYIFRFGAEVWKTVPDKKEYQKVEQQTKALKCELRDYSCDKLSTVEHIKFKHSEK